VTFASRSAGPWLALFLAVSTGLGAADEETACAAGGVFRPGAAGLVGQAVEVLGAAGYDPRDYRVELRRERFPDDPAPGDSGVAIVFVPLDPARGHTLAVWSARPCVLGWLPGASTLTAWQREALERVRDHVREIRPEWLERDDRDLDVTETRDRIAFRLSTGAGAGNSGEFRVLLRKTDLAVIAAGETIRLAD